MFENLGGGELMLILLAVLVLFGPKKIPELAHGLGKGLREFKKASQDLQNNLAKAVGEEDFKNIADSVKSIKTDVTSSVQKLTEHFQSATEQANNAPTTRNLALAAPVSATELPAAELHTQLPAVSDLPAQPSSSMPEASA